MYEVLLKDLRSLVHNMLAHDNEQLAALKGRDIAKTEVVLDNFYDCSHLLRIVMELEQDWSQSSGSS